MSDAAKILVVQRGTVAVTIYFSNNAAHNFVFIGVIGFFLVKLGCFYKFSEVGIVQKLYILSLCHQAALGKN